MPDAWPGLLPSLVGAATQAVRPHARAGAVRALAEVAGEVADDAALAAAPVLLPAMAALAADKGVGLGVRSRAAGVARTLLTSLADARGVAPAAARAAAEPHLGAWFGVVGGVLQEPAAAQAGFVLFFFSSSVSLDLRFLLPLSAGPG